MSVAETNQPIDKTTELQTKLHQADVRDAQRWFHTPSDKLYLSHVLRSALDMVKRKVEGDSRKLRTVSAWLVGILSSRPQ